MAQTINTQGIRKVTAQETAIMELRYMYKETRDSYLVAIMGRDTNLAAQKLQLARVLLNDLKNVMEEEEMQIESNKLKELKG